jgi:hypothetical protein
MGMKRFSSFYIFLVLVPLFLPGCLGSDISQKFYAGSRRQEGIDTNSLYLWKRSPAIAAGDFGLLSTHNLDAIVPKSLHNFRGVLDIHRPISSHDLSINYSHANPSAPTFFQWAGRRVPWKDNSDFRALFAYHEASKAIAYADSLISGEYLKELPSKLFAWRQAVCDDGVGGQVQGSKTCLTASDILAAPVLPVVVVADAAAYPGGEASDATFAGFCPFFNFEYQYNSDPYCLNRDDGGAWKSKWHSGEYGRLVVFYRDHEFKSFNTVDDGDVVVHEMAHLLQTAINPELMEAGPGVNYHLDAIIEGSADFFAAAYRRDDRLFRYTLNNIYKITPNEFEGYLSGRYRDPDNALSFPAAYSYRSFYDIGRVLSAAMNDYRKLRQGRSVAKILNSSNIDPIDNQGSAAWDIAVGLLFQTFHELDPDDGDPLTLDGMSITFNSFAGKLIETCASTPGCGSAKLRLVLENRGILTPNYYDPAAVSATPWSQSITTGNNFLVQLGQSLIEDDQAEERWGLHMPKTLGWAPFMPGGSTRFANDDGVLNPCEVIVVFPQISNNTHLAAWGAARTSLDANATFPVTGVIAGFASIPGAIRGADIVDMQWWISSIPLGFQNFQHPELGYPDPFSEVNEANKRGVPFLRPGESTQALVRNQESRLYTLNQEKAFDRPWSSKVVTKPANRAKLRSSAGWIFRLPNTPADPDEPDQISARVSFRVSYGVYNRDQFVRQETVHSVLDNEGTRSLQTSLTFSQSLRVSSVDVGFCNN